MRAWYFGKFATRVPPLYFMIFGSDNCDKMTRQHVI